MPESTRPTGSLLADGFRRARRRRRAGGDRGPSRVPAGGEARARRSSLGVRFAAGREDVPQAIVSALSYDDRVLLERHVDGRELSVGVLDGERAADRRDPPAGRGPLLVRGPYESAAPTSACPAELDDRASWPCATPRPHLGGAACEGFAGVDLIWAARAAGARGERGPRAHGTSLSRWRPRPRGSASRNSAAARCSSPRRGGGAVSERVKLGTPDRAPSADLVRGARRGPLLPGRGQPLDRGPRPGPRPDRRRGPCAASPAYRPGVRGAGSATATGACRRPSEPADPLDGLAPGCRDRGHIASIASSS